MTHLIIDFETMGKDAGKCAVIDCSVMVFDFDRFLTNPYTIASISQAKRFKLSVTDQVKNYGFDIDKSTLQFWEEQSPEVRANIAPKKSDLTVKEFVKQFHEFLIESPKIDYWWSRSNTFDPIILSRLFAAEGKLLHLDEYLKYWRVRDTRTFIDAKLNFPKENSFSPLVDSDKWNKVFKKHDSSWDILADVLRLQQIYRAENDLELS
jgi:3' exoribonuclease, RNase T-like